MKTKQTKAQRIVELERKLKIAEASLIYRHHFADVAIHKASTDRLMGSGVILTLTTPGGDDLFEPVMIRNGLSNETIEMLKSDLRRSFLYATEFKPNGV